MSVRSGFFNSVSGDRVYDAEDFSKLFKGIINDGVFSSVGNKFYVTLNNSNMIASVGTGRGFFRGIWIENDATYNLNISSRHVSFARKDVVVIRINMEDRVADIRLLTGTPASTPVRPELMNTSTIKDYPIWEITVPSQASSSSISGKRIVGTSECPYVTAPITSISIDEIVENLEPDFVEWFESIKGILDEDTAGHLQNEIDDLDSDITATDGRVTQVNNSLTTVSGRVTTLENTSSSQASSITTINNKLSSAVPQTKLLYGNFGFEAVPAGQVVFLHVSYAPTVASPGSSEATPFSGPPQVQLTLKVAEGNSNAVKYLRYALDSVDEYGFGVAIFNTGNSAYNGRIYWEAKR